MTGEEKKNFQIRRCGKCGRPLPRWLDICPVCLKKADVFLRLLELLKPFRWHATAGLILTLFLTALNLVPPYLMKILVDDALVSSDEISKRLNVLFYLGIALVTSYTLSGGISMARGWLMSWMNDRLVLNLRNRIFFRLQELSLSFYNRKETGQIMSRLTNDIYQLQFFLTEGFQQMVVSVLTILGIGVVLFSLNPGLAVVVTIPLPVVVFVIYFFGRRVHRVFHQVWRKMGELSARLAETIPGVRVVKAFSQEQSEIERFNRQSEDIFRFSWRALRMLHTYQPVVFFLTTAGSVIIWWFGGRQVIMGKMSLGVLIAFTGYMWQFYHPVEMLAGLNHQLQRAATAAERIFEITDAKSDISDAPDAVELSGVEGRIVFKNVDFSYDPESPVLTGVNLEVKPGEVIGLVGHSGAGKTTLINLIMRFYDVTSGEILLDGVDVRKTKLKFLRSQFGVVLQEPFLFQGSVADNISYGNPGADLKEIISAARAAMIHDFIMNLPEGYDTLVGERGVKLSAGEKQRISIARAILKNPRVLILDEATASVDTETEVKIQHAIENLIQGRTTFIIAHRISTLRNASRLVVLEKGKVVETGSHEELLARENVYHRLVKLQSDLNVRFVGG